MPITNICFSGGICSLKESGRITTDDANYYVKTIQQYANTSEEPIVVLIDAREVRTVMPLAQMIFIQSSTLPNVIGYIIITDENFAESVAKTLGSRNPNKNTFIYRDENTAHIHALKLAESVYHK